MIQSTNIIITPDTTTNPDSAAIKNKKTIDISLDEFDVSASGAPVAADYNARFITVRPTITGSSKIAELYFTPLYVEKINYNEWSKTVNKTFEELGNI